VGCYYAESGIEAVVWSWSYGSWIYNYMSSHCLSPLKFQFESRSWRGALNTTLCDKVVGGFLPVSSSNITEILLKVVLSTITLTLTPESGIAKIWIREDQYTVVL